MKIDEFMALCQAGTDERLLQGFLSNYGTIKNSETHRSSKSVEIKLFLPPPLIYPSHHWRGRNK